MKKVDPDTILNHPTIDFYHKFFLLKLRDSSITVYTDANSVKMLLNNKIIFQENAPTIVITQLRSYNNKLKILGHLKSPVFSFVEKPVLYAEVNGENQKLEMFESTASSYKTKLKTNKFWGFYFEKDLSDDCIIKFKVKMDNFIYDVKYYFMPFTPIILDKKFLSFTTENGIVQFNENSFIYLKVSDIQRKMVIKEKSDNIRKINPVIYNYRLTKEFNQKRKIWLYYDCKGVTKDNGYYQFVHDAKINDGVDRYYVINNEDSKGLFEDKSHLVEFGSNKHKSLFINADKIITAYIEKNNIYPFSDQEMQLLIDILQYEVVYLQHGILHASTPWKYTPEVLQIDKIVISSYFEESNFIRKYNFKENALLRSGMPRFDYIDDTKKPKNRILFAPSWRNYLIKPQVNNYWEPENEKFKKSDYYILFNQFLNSPKLEKVLAENEVYLDFKIHPIFTAYLKLFDNTNEHVSFAGSVVNDEEYAAFITDFSSFVFDFAYLKRPIMYFVPDYLQFKSGMSQYRELDLPFDKAFGKLVTDPDSAVNEIVRIIKNSFLPDPVFTERMNHFYLPMDNCCESLYNYLKEE